MPAPAWRNVGAAMVRNELFLESSFEPKANSEVGRLGERPDKVSDMPPEAAPSRRRNETGDTHGGHIRPLAGVHLVRSSESGKSDSQKSDRSIRPSAA